MPDVLADWASSKEALGVAVEVKSDATPPPVVVGASWVIPASAIGIAFEIKVDPAEEPPHSSWTTPSDALGVLLEVAKEGSPPPGPETSADWTTPSSALAVAFEVASGPGGPAGFVTADWATASDTLGLAFEVRVEATETGATWTTPSDALGVGLELKTAPPPPPPDPPIGSPAPTPEQMRQGLARNLSVLPGCQVAAYPLANPTLPYIEIVSGEVEYDVASRRGADMWTFIVRVFVAYTTDIGSQKRLDQFLQSAGEFSVKEAVEEDTHIGLEGVDWTIVTGASGQREYTSREGTSLVGCEWTVQIMASGI